MEISTFSSKMFTGQMVNKQSEKEKARERKRGVGGSGSDGRLGASSK